MKLAYLLPLFGLLFAGAAQAQSTGWRDDSGKPVAETASMKSQSDFAGSLLLTTEEDWQEK